ncbi:hypothetical protein F5B20DRAFT_577254 [Whalleya microplaca]|nr:hypothetical protein F5B20DRAFT_577254 [Whalleya microplaca]
MSSQPKKPSKGILKKPSTAATTTTTTTTTIAVTPPTPDTSRTPDPKARAIAEQHARIIHDRRSLEDSISDSLLYLSKFPLSPSPSPSSTSSPSTASPYTPTPTDISAFKSHIRLFQPSDYDDLIAERNALGKCGWALCPRPRARLGAGAFKLVNKGRRDFGIVPRAEYERWCSGGGKSRTDCARAAMYVKVQLIETAAWERAGISSIQIELLDEPELGAGAGARATAGEEDGSNNDTDADRLAKDVEALKLEIEAARKAARDARDLALERGDTGKKGVERERSVNVTIREKTAIVAAEEPLLDQGAADGHLILDGYKTKFDAKKSHTMGNKGSSNLADIKEGNETAE